VRVLLNLQLILSTVPPTRLKVVEMPVGCVIESTVRPIPRDPAVALSLQDKEAVRFRKPSTDLEREFKIQREGKIWTKNHGGLAIIWLSDWLVRV